MLRIAIVEDEAEMRDILKKYLNLFFDEKKLEINIFEYEDAIKFIDKYKCEYNLIFMDINLPHMTGLEAAKKIRELDKSTMLIFVTNLVQFAVNGYQVQAFDYLVKPINYYNFALTMNRALPSLNSSSESILVIDNKRAIHRILLSKLKYIEVVDHILKFHLSDQIIESYDSLKKYESMLTKFDFFSCNRCYLVNLRYVTSIVKNEAVLGDEKLLISRPKKVEFIQALNRYLSGSQS